jgi:microcompartment protein CcmK/EutM
MVPNPPFRDSLGTLPKTIQAGASFLLKVKFCPQDTLFVSDTDLIISNNPTALVVILEGNAPVKRGILSVQATLDFGAIHKGGCRDSGFYAHNIGDDTLRITTPIVSGANFTLITPPGAFSIKPHDSVLVTVRYCASDSGLWLGNATLASTLSARTVTLRAFTGLGVLSIPKVIDFGPQPIGPCKDDTISISNVGTDTLFLKALASFTPPFSYVGADPIVLAPGQAKVITIRFCPTDTTEATENVRLDTVHAGVSPQFTVQGGGLHGTLSVSGSPIDFGCLTTSMTVKSTILLRNMGGAGLKLVYVKFLSGKNVSIVRTANDSLAAGATDSVIVAASSSVPDTAFGVLEIQYQGIPPRDVPISAHISTAPKITTLDPILNFDTLNIGDTSIDTCIRITNYSCLAVDSIRFVLGGTNGASFRVETNSIPKLVDSAIATVCVRFIPGQGGMQTATLLAISGTNTTQVAILTGIAKGQPVSVQLVIDTVYGRPGQIVNDPVHTLNDVTVAAITSVTFRVQFDPMQLDLKTPVAPTTSSIARADASNTLPVYTMKKYSFGDWEITANYSAPITGKPVIAELPFEILLPTASIAPIRLLSATFGISPATLALKGNGEIIIQQCDTTERFAAAPPSAIKVSQNSPNPFNPRTTVRLEVRAPGHVKIEVLNLLGQTVLIPFEQDVSSGERAVEIDGGALASGVYRYVTTWSSPSGSPRRVRDAKTMVIVK